MVTHNDAAHIDTVKAAFIGAVIVFVCAMVFMAWLRHTDKRGRQRGKGARKNARTVKRSRR